MDFVNGFFSKRHNLLIVQSSIPTRGRFGKDSTGSSRERKTLNYEEHLRECVLAPSMMALARAEVGRIISWGH